MWLLVWLLSTAEAAPDLLLLGNSYTARNRLDARVAEAIASTGPPGVLPSAEALTGGGRRLADHAAFLDTRPEYLEAFEGLHDRVVLQDQSQIPGFPPDDPAFLASLDGAVALRRAADGTGARTLLFLTWGRRDGDAQNPTRYPDFEAMQDRLTAGYRAYQARLDAEPGPSVAIAPVGEAFRQVLLDLRADGADPLASGSPFHALYAGDGSHPSPAGTYLAAAVIAASVTGRAPHAPHPDLPAPVTDALSEVAARVVLDDPFAPWAHAWAYDLARWEAERGLDAPISGAWDTPLVAFDAVVDLDTLRLGVDHGGVPGEGRAWCLDGGALTLDDGIVGEAGEGTLRVQGCTLEASRITVGRDAGAHGTVRLEGGTLRVPRLLRGEGTDVVEVLGGRWEDLVEADGPLDVLGGILAPDPSLVVHGELALGPDATLSLGLDGLPLVVDGLARLEGPVVLAADPAPGTILMIAERFDPADPRVEGPGGPVAVEHGRTDDGRDVLLVASPDDRGGDAEEPTAGPPGAVPPTEGCACSGSGAAGAGWVALLGGLVLRRRRPRGRVLR